MGPEHNANFGNLYTYFIAQLVRSLRIISLLYKTMRFSDYKTSQRSHHQYVSL